MKQAYTIKELRALTSNAQIFPSEILDWIARENLWNLWVPNTFGGIEASLREGLQTLRELAKTDGSLGWTITLCSGANYFIGNLQEEVAKEIFLTSATPVCFGGSGGVFGKAEKVGDSYSISGKWHYATGAPYLSHFTLNATVIENGQELMHKNGTPVIRSFVVPRKDVQIIEDWNTMGLKATATHSFEVNKIELHKKYSFLYNKQHLPQPIFKIHFSVFADLTLWVNYLGMAEHFLEEAKTLLPTVKLGALEGIILSSLEQVDHVAQEVEKAIKSDSVGAEDQIHKLHQKATTSVSTLSNELLKTYVLLGIKASRINHPLNQIFRDYFTATQHHIFRES